MEKGIVNSHLIEFGYELAAVVPYAYYLHRKGLLKKTISGVDTKFLYYFSPEHIEVQGRRSWDNMSKALRDKIPNVGIHKKHLDYSKWLPPNYAAQYYNKDVEEMFSKPILVISNKKHLEWNKGYYNTFNEGVLNEIFGLLYKDYSIIYNDLSLVDQRKYNDTRDYERYDVNELLWLYNIHRIDKVMDMLSVNDYNLAQLILFSSANCFISVQGGGSIFASYFKKPHLIYANKGNELKCGSFDGWYQRLSDGNVIVSQTHEDLIKKIKENF